MKVEEDGPIATICARSTITVKSGFIVELAGSITVTCVIAIVAGPEHPHVETHNNNMDRNKGKFADIRSERSTIGVYQLIS